MSLQSQEEDRHEAVAVGSLRSTLLANRPDPRRFGLVRISLRRTLMASACVFGFGLFQAAGAVDFPVTTLADAGAGSLRQAVLDANALPGPDTVSFALGAGPNTISLTTGQIVISDDLVINGPGAADLSVSGTNNSRIFDVDGGAIPIEVTIFRLTLTEGNGDGGDGGALRVRSDDRAILVDSVVTGNDAFTGGGIQLDDASYLRIVRSSVSGNTARFSGGGLYNGNNSVLRIEDNSLISQNIATDSGGGIGYSADLTILDSTVSGNTAGDEGGGLYSEDGNIRIERSTIADNQADAGGGIENGGDLVIIDSTLSRNRALDGDGGGILGAADITNSTLSGNTATGDGGGIHDNRYDVVVRNSTITGNGVTDAAGQGGGIYSEDQVMLENTIVSGNTAVGGAAQGPDVYGDFDASFSLFGDLTGSTGIVISPATGNIMGPPGVGALANNGGPTLTHLPLAGSAAIDAGEPGPSPLVNDQRGPGFPRVQNGRLDIGAVEVRATAPPRGGCGSPI